MKNLFRSALTFLFITLSINSLLAQGKKALSLDDYKDWNRITNVVLSPDGDWMTYSYAPNEGDALFMVRELDKDTVYSALNAKRVEFSENSQWVGFLIDPMKKEAEQLRKQKKAVNSSFQLLNLETNDLEEVLDVKSFVFSKNSGFVAIHKVGSDKDAKHRGTDLILKDFKGGTSLSIGNVMSYSFNESGSHLSYLVDADGSTGNGIYVIKLDDFSTKPIHNSDNSYSHLIWDKSGKALTALYGKKDEGYMQRANSLIWATDIDGKTTIKTFTASNPSLPVGYVISEYRSLSWNKEGTQVYFGIKEQQEELKKEDELEANVDVWHWKDENVQSRQMITANNDKRATELAVLNIKSQRFIRLGYQHISRIQTNEESKWVVASIDTAYNTIRDLPSGYADLYAINTENGVTTGIAQKVFHNLGFDPLGRYLAYSKEGQVLLYDFSKGKTMNITERTERSFTNEEFDVPVEKPTYGIAGWSSDGDWVMLNTKFDIYAFALNSTEVKSITRGVGGAEDIRFRLTQLDREAKTYDISEPLLLSAYGEWTKQSGYYEVEIGKSPKALHYVDKMVGRPIKAKNSDRIIFTEQTFEEFPNYWVSNTEFRKPKQITDANPQQSEYKWGRRILVDYVDERGNQLQATLALPADYRSGQKYPMIIYFYEKMSQRHHQYSMPTYDDRPHMSTYASNGYLVLMPDIVYDEGKPGTSALDDVVSAANKVIDMGYADPERIGLQGHSWGGYESSFILTQTDMFACVVTGAPLTNLVSFYNLTYKRTGNMIGPILEWSQGRMGVSPWDNMELYRSQSPIHHAENINTPFLILHGTEDGAVDWNQGLEYFQAAHRLGKEVILLSYPGEPHHLRKEANQKDFQIRMKQYFDHYLKGVEAPLWLSKGVNHLDKKRIKPEDR